MTGRIFTSDHHVYDLPALLEWNVVHTGTVPCDSYSVTFLYQKEMAARQMDYAIYEKTAEKVIQEYYQKIS